MTESIEKEEPLTGKMAINISRSPGGPGNCIHLDSLNTAIESAFCCRN